MSRRRFGFRRLLFRFLILLSKNLPRVAPGLFPRRRTSLRKAKGTKGLGVQLTTDFQPVPNLIARHRRRSFIAPAPIGFAVVKTHVFQFGLNRFDVRTRDCREGSENYRNRTSTQ
jgi:hypothetical protein